MEYITDDGEKIRVGLEIKSKQTTPARTSLHSMRQADSSHARQIVAYSHMFDCEYYVILYGNYAKKGWFMSAEDYEKTPDIRAFCARVTDVHKWAVVQKQADVTRAVRERNAPKLDIVGWTCNKFKQACANELEEEEMDERGMQAEQAKKSNLKPYEIANIVRAVNEIEELRKGTK